ncbi:MAG: AAA family ATPase [Dehalococcoidales bacterium]|nr:AAA family ATPase [Dehalococcoidales bacterium]
MVFSIAVAGKGGSGKTSLCGLIIRYLRNHDLQPILAVDADPNANLGEALGMEVKNSVGMILDRFQREKIDIPSGMSKDAYLEWQLNTLLLESRYFDLLTMSKTEGQGCYCYPNTVLRKFVDRLSENYAYIVMDNEAGMEHLSRGTTQDIDELLIVSNHSVRGVRTLARIKELVRELKLRIKHQSIIINMVPAQLDPLVADEMDKLGLELNAIIPLDDQINQYDLAMKSILDLPDASPAVQAIDRFFNQLLSK